MLSKCRAIAMQMLSNCYHSYSYNHSYIYRNRNILLLRKLNQRKHGNVESLKHHLNTILQELPTAQPDGLNGNQPASLAQGQRENGSASETTTLARVQHGQSGHSLGTTGVGTLSSLVRTKLEQALADNPTLARLEETLETELQTLKSGAKCLLEEVEQASSLSQLAPLQIKADRIKAEAELLSAMLDEVLQKRGTVQDNMRLITSLMFHYPQAYSTDGLSGDEATMVREIKKAVMRDWADDFKEFPSVILGEACKRWRRCEQGKFRPSIAELRSLCFQVWGEAKQDKKHLLGRALMTVADQCEQKTANYQLKQKYWNDVMELAAKGVAGFDGMGQQERQQILDEHSKMTRNFSVTFDPAKVDLELKYFNNGKYNWMSEGGSIMRLWKVEYSENGCYIWPVKETVEKWAPEVMKKWTMNC